MAVHNNFNSAFRSMYRQLNSVQRSLPSVLANVGTRFWVDSFNKEGFVDKFREKWPTPKRRIKGTPEYMYPKKRDLGRRTRKMLVKSGALRREANNSLKMKSFKMIMWRMGLPYAKYLNYGTNTIPARKFMGESLYLNGLFRKKIIEAYRKAFGSAV